MQEDEVPPAFLDSLAALSIDTGETPVPHRKNIHTALNSYKPLNCSGLHPINGLL